MYRRRLKGLGVGLRAPTQKPDVQASPDSSQSLVSSALQDIINRPPSTSSETSSNVLSQDFFDKKSIPASTPKKGSENVPDSDPDEVRIGTDELLNILKSPSKMPRSPEPRAKKIKKDHSKNKEQYQLMNSKSLLSYMEDVVVSAGFFLQKNELPNILREDQVIFIHNVSKALKSGPVEKNVSVFMKDFEKYYEDRSLLFKALSPTQTGSDCNIARGQTQDSLVHLLLQVDCLEPNLMEYLLEKMGELSMEEDVNESDVSTVTWIRMILQSFRFLNTISDPSTMNTRLFDIIHATTDPVVQREIIVCLPDIIGDLEHFKAASELSKLLREKPALTTAILDALTNLSLQSETRAEVQESLLRSLRRAPVEYLPSMVKFLVSVSSADEANEIIEGLRRELFPSQNSLLSQARSQNPKAADLASFKKLVFNMIRYGLLVSKVLADSWLKNIESVDDAKGLKALDILVLLILYSIAANPSKKKALEAVFRNNVMKGVLKVSLMEEVFSSFLLIVEDNFASLMKILSVLLKSPQVVVTEFASEVYCNCFSHVEGQWCKWIVTELFMYVGAGDATNTRSSLLILNQLAESQLNKLKNFAVLLTSLLNKLNEIGLNEVRMLMDILSRIAYSSPNDINSDCYTLQDEINMLARKQLASSQINTVRNGVVSTVMIIKHIASVPGNEPNEWPDRASEIDFPLTERAKKSFPLLDLVMASTRLNAEAQGLFFDQLSKLIFRSKNLDRLLLYRISVAMKNNLQESFLINVTDFTKNKNSFDYALQFSLEENEDDSIALDLTSLVIKDHERRTPVDSVLFPLLILPSLVRLLRALESEDLSEIDALLVCPISMPTSQTLEEFINLSPDDQTIVMNTLFYCVNWYREIINAFACFIRKNCGDKVLIRLRLIIWLQNQISKCLPKMIIPDYCPPKCHFHTAVKSPVQSADKTKKKAGKKSGKKTKAKKLDKTSASTSKVNDNTTVLSDCTQNKEDANKESDQEIEVEKLADLNLYNDFFRELDVDVWLLLTYKLTVNPTPPTNATFTAELGPNELLFLLEDFVFKLEHCLVSSVKKISHLKTSNTNPIGLDSISSIPALSIAKNCLRLIPELCTHRNTIIECSKNLLLANDYILDSRGMFMPESKDIKLCLGLIFKALTAILSWNGFKSQQHYELLKAGLVRLAEDSGVANDDMSLEDLVAKCCSYLCSIEEQILHLASAQNLVALYQALLKYIDDETSNETLGKLCYKFLKRRWFTLDGAEEHGSSYNKVIESFLFNYLSMNENRLALLEEFITLVEDECKNLTTKDSTLNSLPTINKSTFNVLMKALCKSVEGAVRQGLSKSDSDVEKLETWTTTTNILEKIVRIVKTNDNRSNLITFVTSSLGLLRLFNTHGIPVCSVQFRLKNTEVSQVLRKLQILTRYIQTICNHTKVAEDTTLAARLPSIRSAMETVVLQVKNLVVLNGCTDAFYLGSMRNKNLKGEEIPSQSTIADEDSGDDRMSTGDGNSDDEENASANESNGSESEKSDCERDSIGDEDRAYSSSV